MPIVPEMSDTGTELERDASDPISIPTRVLTDKSGKVALDPGSVEVRYLRSIGEEVG